MKLPPTGPTFLADRLGCLDRMAEAARTAPPAPGAWSPVEIGEHVYRVETATLRGIQKPLAEGDAQKDVHARSRTAVVRLLAAMRAPKKVKVPEEAQWASAAAPLPAPREGKPLIRHPFAVALTFDEALRFLVAHASRHRRLAQAERR